MHSAQCHASGSALTPALHTAWRSAVHPLSAQALGQAGEAGGAVRAHGSASPAHEPVCLVIHVGSGVPGAVRTACRRRSTHGLSPCVAQAVVIVLLPHTIYVQY